MLRNLATCLVLAFGAVTNTVAQPYPAKPITLVVGTEPGGAPDVLARIIGPKLSDALRQPIIVENKPGADGTIAAAQDARARPDGYTLFIGTVSTNAIAKSLYANLAYDPERSFAPVGQIASVPLMIVVPTDLPAKNIAELIAFAKSKPGQLNYSSPGAGGPQHLSAELFKTMAGIDVVHVPYKSGAAAVTAVLSGQAQLSFPGMPPALPHVKSGKLRAVAVTTDKRSAAAPDIPTVAEAGLKGFEADNWHALFAPAKTPSEVVQMLNAEMAKVLAQGDVKEQMLRVGADPRHSSSADLGKLVGTETMRWSSVVKTSGARIE